MPVVPGAGTAGPAPAPATDRGRTVEVLDPLDCHRLLSTVGIGRLGYTRDALPTIAPVCFRLHEGNVVIPARVGGQVLSGTRGAVVAFQADSFDQPTRSGWTVTVVGPSRSITAGPGLAVLDALPWPARAVPPDRCYVSVTMALVRGWQTLPDSPLTAL